MVNLEIKNLTVNLESSNIITNLSFEVKQNEKIVITGESGTGKSLLLKCILDLYKDYSGSIILFGETNSQVALQTGKVGVVMQQPLIDYKLTLKENLLMFRELYNYKDNIDKILSDFSLSKFENKNVLQLSSKIRRKIDLIRLIFSDQKLLILDEPTTGLDIQFQEIFWDFMNEKIESGASILYTSGNPNEIKQARINIELDSETDFKKRCFNNA